MDIITLFNHNSLSKYDPDSYLNIGNGINISATDVSKAIVDSCH